MYVTMPNILNNHLITCTVSTYHIYNNRPNYAQYLTDRPHMRLTTRSILQIYSTFHHCLKIPYLL